MPAPETTTKPQGAAPLDKNTVLELRGLRKEYHVHSGKTIIKAVDGISFKLGRGEILGLVGESGCGKTTTGKLIMRLIKPTSGSIMVGGEDTSSLTENTKESDFAYRRKVQMIFQTPTPR